MNNPIERKIYTDRIKGFFNKRDLIKVITGVRRSGKSEILKLLKGEALKITDEQHIIFANFEEAEFSNILTYKKLHDYVTDKMTDDKRYYIFLDEIQMVKDWERAVNSLRLRNTDIFVTGSNSQLLSGELATLIAGRYVSFEINPLSYEEFVKFRQESRVAEIEAFNPKTRLDIADDISKSKLVAISVVDDLDEYIQIGGFPLLSTTQFSTEQARQLVLDIHSSAVLKDVVARNKVKNVPLLEKIIAFVYDNVGSLITLRRISDYLKSNSGSGDLETIGNYIRYLENACIIRKVSRYDIKGKELLKSNDKYYLADHSLQYTIGGFKRTNLPGILENIVYNELIRRGYKVYVGKMGKDDNREIDFVAEKLSEKIYVQVCTAFSSNEVIDREFNPLLDIKDNYPKYVVTLDKYWQENKNGVVGIHLKDFLLKEVL